MSNSYIYSLNLDELKSDINGKTILITGGTGSFGKRMIKTLLAHSNPAQIIIFSRDEYKQYLLRKLYANIKIIKFVIGDIRDYDRLHDVFYGVDIIFHAAALKQVPATEYNPFEAIKTNINGSKNVIRAAIFNGVKKVIAISTDKCVNPINLYGATKLCAERLFVDGNLLSRESKTIFSVLRYGNVLASRGSVIPIFLEQKRKGEITITDENMSRFTITLQDAVHFVLSSLHMMQGGEVFVPKLPSYTLKQLASVLVPDVKKNIIGIRPGEKMHEKMISEDESYNTIECTNFFVVRPFFTNDLSSVDYLTYYKKYNGKMLSSNYSYSSGENDIIDSALLKTMIDTELQEGP
jgi:UDP-N-acetylglucosamine 4,6-dehydratase